MHTISKKLKLPQHYEIDIKEDEQRTQWSRRKLSFILDLNMRAETVEFLEEYGSDKIFLDMISKHDS